MLLGIVSLQRSFRAASHHARTQVQQARLIDYIARDLRRAITVEIDQFHGAERLKLTIPDFYNPDGTAKDPVIKAGKIQYGENPQSVQVAYYQIGATVFRSENDEVERVVTDAPNALVDYTDRGQQVDVMVSFVPEFQLNARDVSGLRLGTAVYSTTLLRNKRAN